MSRRNRKQQRVDVEPIELAAQAVEETIEASESVVEFGVRPGAARFLVRCADPMLRGYSVRGVRIPQGGSAEVEAHEPDHVSDIINDRAVIAEPIS